MILKTLKYSESASETRTWELDKYEMREINLLVGKNASGKSRTLSIIISIANLVCGDLKFAFKSGNYELEFLNKNENIKYFLAYEDGVITKERFTVNRKVLLDRGNNGIGKIYAVQLKRNIKFQVPNTQLACVARRDSVQHPFFQTLYEWGKSTRFYLFGTELGRSAFAVYNKSDEKDHPNLKNPDDVVRIYKLGLDAYGDKYNDLIIKSMYEIGYNIAEIGVEANPNLKVMSGLNVTFGHCLYVIEEDIGAKIYQMELSQGMFRCLSLLAQIYYSQLSGSTDLILIDDIGEGLDFERSTSLINILIDSAKNASYQLIMSTNDRFVMNNVPLEYWGIIQRKGKHCKIFTNKNSKNMFDKFAYTGLSNFDFFTMDFINEAIH